MWKILLFTGIFLAITFARVLKKPFYHSIKAFRMANEQGLKGFNSFVRTNPKTDKFISEKFHHVEFYTGEATATYARFMHSLGMDLISKSDFSSGNQMHASYLIQSGDMRMLFTTPYNSLTNITGQGSLPGFDVAKARQFIISHGLGVRAIAIEVADVCDAYNTLSAAGAETVLSPVKIEDTFGNGFAHIAEIKLYGDTVLRLINVHNFTGSFLPNFIDCQEKNRNHPPGKFGIQRFDHIVGNVWKLGPVLDYMKRVTGFHEFAEFVSDDVGTVDSGLNSVVLANNNEFILLPINEPVFGTRRKSQIQTYLEQYSGEGVQHLALFTDDIFFTLSQMKKSASTGIGFSFMKSPGEGYYNRLKDRIGSIEPLTEEQIQLAKDLGVLIDRDDQGMLLQIFTQPIGDRPTVFLEIIQRVGCVDAKENYQKPGCGGFGKGNFKDLFRSIEEYENSLGINESNEGSKI